MPELLASLNPGLLLIAAGIVCALVPQRQIRQALTLAAPLIGLVLLVQAPHGQNLAEARMMGLDLVLYRVDNLNFIFALAFLIAVFLNAIYAMHDDNRLHDGVALIYGGASVAAVLAGDLMTLFIFWEVTAISSVVVIIQARTRAAYGASMRYLAIQILSGVLLLNGAAWYLNANETLILPGQVGEAIGLNEPGAWLLFVAFGIKAAFPLLHSWLVDAYPKATATGAVVLSAFTTKLAVYTLARFFPGESLLLWIGAAMALFPVFLALIENDLRKVLALGLVSQNGFMLAAVGAASGDYVQTALNGAAGHAFVCVIYMGLLFMVTGALIHRAGTAKISELGGMFRSMPVTAMFAIIGGLTLAAVPLFSAFATKSLIIEAVKSSAAFWAWIALYAASAGVLAVGALKVPFHAFFGRDSGKRVEEAPFNMLLAMGFAAFLCIVVGLPGIIPGFGYEVLYNMLPYPEAALGYHLFTASHVLTQLQLLVLAVLAFMLLRRFGLYPAERPGLVLDSDWIYRKAGYDVARWANRVWNKAGPAMSAAMGRGFARLYDRIEAASSPQGQLSRGLVSQSMAVWTAVILGIVLILTLIVAS
jgi:multicomponent Na+:H+ antiporter subunit D